MKVRINDDATGFGFDNMFGRWVEQHRGKEFEVRLRDKEKDKTYLKEVKWIVIDKLGFNGITESQATLVEEPIIINFGDLPIGSSFKTTNNDVAIKITKCSYFCLYGNNKFKTVISSPDMQVYSISLNIEIEKYKPEYLPFKIDFYRKLYIYKNGDVKYYLNDKYVASKNIDEIKSILKWTKKSKAGNYLSDNSVLKVGCQDFTIKDIKDFAIIYEDYVDK